MLSRHLLGTMQTEYFHHHRKFYRTMLLWASSGQTTAFGPNTAFCLLLYDLQAKKCLVFKWLKKNEILAIALVVKTLNLNPIKHSHKIFDFTFLACNLKYLLSSPLPRTFANSCSRYCLYFGRSFSVDIFWSSFDPSSSKSLFQIWCFCSFNISAFLL